MATFLDSTTLDDYLELVLRKLTRFVPVELVENLFQLISGCFSELHTNGRAFPMVIMQISAALLSDLLATRDLTHISWVGIMMPAASPAIAVHTTAISLPVLHSVVPIFSAHLIQRMADIGPIASPIASVESRLIESLARWSFWFLAVVPLPVGAATATVRIDIIMARPTVLAGIPSAIVNVGLAVRACKANRA